MAADEMTPGEVNRTFARHEDALRVVGDRITGLAKSMVPVELWSAQHQALQSDLADLKADTRDAFARAEATSLERRNALQARDKDLAAETANLRAELDRKVVALKKELAAERKAERELENSTQSKGTTKTANVIAAIVALAAVATLVVTLVGQGGR